MTFVIHIEPGEDLWKKLKEIKEKRLARGYPKIGTILTAIKSGNPNPGWYDGVVTEGKEYEVVDNGDYQGGYYHVMGDLEWCFVRLTPSVLKEYFGVEYSE